MEVHELNSSRDATLLRSSIFEGISDHTIADLCSHGEIVSFEANHKLFERGDDAPDLMILREGVVELLFPVQIMGVTRDVTMERKQAGDVVAWSSVVSPYRCTLSARCAGRCSLTALSRETLGSFFEAHPETGCTFMRNLAGVIGRRLDAMQMMWMQDLQTSAVKRLG